MTTRFVTQTALAFVLVTLSYFFLIDKSEAQSDDNQLINQTIATTTQQSTTTAVKEDDNSWFRLEKLSGDNFTQGDFVVGPGKFEIEGKPGDVIVREISVTNRVSDNRVFELSVEDISGSSDPNSSVVLLGQEKGPYTIKDYISFPNKTFKLNLGERAWIPVTITIPPDAEPGGFYGSVLISTISSEEEQKEQGVRAPVIARVGTLFFVTVPGEVKKEGYTKELSLANNKWWYENGPIKFHILYENTGSIHLNPYGEVRIKNILGEEVGFLEIEPWFALPNSLRTRDIVWDRELLLGRYTATAYINRGYDDVVDEVSTTFWVLPWKAVGVIFLVVFIILLTVRFVFRNFEFKRKT